MYTFLNFLVRIKDMDLESKSESMFEKKHVSILTL